MSYDHGWSLGHMVVSAIVHGVIYDIIFRLFRLLGLPLSIVAGVVVIAAIGIWLRYARPGRRSR
jgi:uncharacterized membrane protein YvlD (DUF360 family)